MHFFTTQNNPAVEPTLDTGEKLRLAFAKRGAEDPQRRIAARLSDSDVSEVLRLCVTYPGIAYLQPLKFGEGAGAARNPEMAWRACPETQLERIRREDPALFDDLAWIMQTTFKNCEYIGLDLFPFMLVRCGELSLMQISSSGGEARPRGGYSIWSESSRCVHLDIRQLRLVASAAAEANDLRRTTKFWCALAAVIVVLLLIFML
jgi:hypothetical protein